MEGGLYKIARPMVMAQPPEMTNLWSTTHLRKWSAWVACIAIDHTYHNHHTAPFHNGRPISTKYTKHTNSRYTEYSNNFSTHGFLCICIVRTFALSKASTRVGRLTAFATALTTTSMTLGRGCIFEAVLIGGSPSSRSRTSPDCGASVLRRRPKLKTARPRRADDADLAIGGRSVAKS